jgi:hypothetical protein
MPRGSLVGSVCPHLQIQDLLVFLYPNHYPEDIGNH